MVTTLSHYQIASKAVGVVYKMVFNPRSIDLHDFLLSIIGYRYSVQHINNTHKSQGRGKDISVFEKGQIIVMLQAQ